MTTSAFLTALLEQSCTVACVKVSSVNRAACAALLDEAVAAGLVCDDDTLCCLVDVLVDNSDGFDHFKGVLGLRALFNATAA